ncbi:cobyric acid synthase [Paenibacillus thermotolerans]|uniref:cobyric acid synthase n=1 Tax=Paenibacillus thermotolerans TaxID=3027807 RepID=UPI0023688CEF|nr:MULTISPECIES: cobyric acid synthase [unclassified Paenibacillus]
MKTKGKTLMIQGTASDVGKSLLTAALCRIFAEEGVRAAPFKSQNMSLNSYVTPDGKEIGRAQGMQADACGVPATTDMNPILLKPSGDRTSQVVVHGKPLRNYDAYEYRESYLPVAESIVKQSLGRLRESYDLVVMEGAGSPAEVNLRDRDIVNMRVAAWADAPVLLVADIDRGGVFASIVGTMDILRPEERDRVKGFIINKFRGDVSLLKPGLDWLEERTGKPVLGVVPYMRDVGLEDEDSAGWKDRETERARAAESRDDVLDIAVIRFSRISNFSDFDAFRGEKDVRIRYISRLEEWGSPDAVILPGTKNTIGDLRELRSEGLDEKLLRYAAEGGHIAGVCGGYQMLCRTLSDPYGVESGAEKEEAGLGLLPGDTVFLEEKRTVRVVGYFTGWGSEEEPLRIPVSGYEIHMGDTRHQDGVRRPFAVGESSDTVRAEGACAEDGRVWGTYVHGVFDNDEFRRYWLNVLRAGKGWTPLEVGFRYRERREAAFSALAEHVRRAVDMNAIRGIAGL